ncbi:BglG family transcription antiterminator [Companilactobacillus jidongensis]|uniref:BglG family transcription antiterminator n=1 Tax=Companilactobacillus jidongensis TaxID=2486006 RepID=UPI000F775C34|nr:BglG family transcription antiterminator [Companilactobacillus jidongensis]
MLDKKQLQIIDKLIQNPILTKDELIKSLSLTDRQIEYSIEKLNQYLSSQDKNNIDSEGVYITVPSDTYKFLLSIRVSDNLTSLKGYILSTEERKLFLVLLLSTNNDYLSLVHLQELLQVSQSTVSKDLKQLEVELLDEQLKISYDRKNGYKIVGNENAVRSYLIKSVANELVENRADLLDNFIKLNSDYKIKNIFNMVSNASNKYDIDFVENRLREFCYILVIILNRLLMKPNYMPAKAKYYEINKTNEYTFSEEILGKLGITNVNTVKYITTIVLCLSIGGYDNLIEDKHIYDITGSIVKQFSDISGISFVDNDKVVHQLFTHFRSMYFRLQFKFPITNPLTKQVIQEYGEIFTLVTQAVVPFREELGKVPDEEIAFLTIHLIGFIYNSNSQKKHFLSAAIVCPNGIGSSALAYLQLTSLFPNIKFLMPFPYSDLDKHIEEIDMIFSTFYRSELFAKGKPCFVINPIMTTNDKYSIMQKVNSEFSTTDFVVPTLDSVMRIVGHNVDNSDMLNRIRKELADNVFKPKAVFNKRKISLLDVLKPEFVKLKVDSADFAEAVSYASQPLLGKKVISQGYVDEIINQINNNESTFIIAPDIALPHTNPQYGAKEIGIGLTTLSEPIFLSKGKRVKYIFVLSAINSTDHLSALQDLMFLLNMKSFLHLLDDPETTVDEVMNFIYKQLNE